jgi:hypothetical protein
MAKLPPGRSRAMTALRELEAQEARAAKKKDRQSAAAKKAPPKKGKVNK